MNVLSAALLSLLVFLTAVAPRRWALLALAAGIFFLTQGASVDVLGLNLFPLRVLGPVALLRVMCRGELKWTQLNRIDWSLIATHHYSALIWLLRSSTLEAQQIASAVDPTVCYLALRGLLGGIADLHWFLRRFAVLLIPFTTLVVLERLTGRSSFAGVGLAQELIYRDGTIRCQGPFRHAILLGSVAASFVPLYTGMVLSGSGRALGLLGSTQSLALVALANSGGPLTSAAVAVLGWGLWPLRRRLYLVRWAICGVVALGALFMKAPIWYLPFKLSAIVGGGGYHRGLLMERAWQHLGEWWIVGMNHKDTASWFPYVLDANGGADVTNHFLAFGLTAGLAALAMLTAVLYLTFSGLGLAVKGLDLGAPATRAHLLSVWAVGLTIVVHCVSWLGVSYFDQSQVVWLLHLAAASAIAAGGRTDSSPSLGADTKIASDRSVRRRSRVSRRSPSPPSPERLGPVVDTPGEQR